MGASRGSPLRRSLSVPSYRSSQASVARRGCNTLRRRSPRNRARTRPHAERAGRQHAEHRPESPSGTPCCRGGGEVVSSTKNQCGLGAPVFQASPVLGWAAPPQLPTPATAGTPKPALKRSAPLPTTIYPCAVSLIPSPSQLTLSRLCPSISPPGPLECVVERSTELVEEFVYLIFRNDQRRTDRNRLADVARDQSCSARPAQYAATARFALNGAFVVVRDDQPHRSPTPRASPTSG